MKMDRFIKVMLVLIVLLLAFNCAKDINLSSNSGNSSTSSSNSGSRNSTTSSNASERNSSPSIFESSVEAATPPPFLQVGKTYGFGLGTSYRDGKVLEIQNTGWLKAENYNGVFWVNINACAAIAEIKPNS